MCSDTESLSPPRRFFRDAHSCFARAAEQRGTVEYTVGVAGSVTRLVFAGDALVPVLTPALEHVRVDASDESPALTVLLFDSESTGVRMVPAPWPAGAYGRKGEIVGYNEDGFRNVYQHGVDVLHTFDEERMLGVYWTRNHRHIPWWERSHPLRTMTHWWTASTLSLQPVHAGAVGTDDGGVLIAGAGGRGKSTTSLACLDGGLLYAGDDYVLADVDKPFVHSLYSTAKLVPENLRRFPRLEPLVSNRDQLEKQKAMFFLYPDRAQQLSAGFPLRAILLPRVTGEHRTTIVPATSRDALAAIAPMTMFLLPGYSDDVFAKVVRLSQSVPCFWLDAGTDLSEIPTAVEDLVATLR